MDELVTRLIMGSKNATYTVKVKGPYASCTCPAYNYKHVCKHIDALRAELGITGALITGYLGDE